MPKSKHRKKHYKKSKQEKNKGCFGKSNANRMRLKYASLTMLAALSSKIQ